MQLSEQWENNLTETIYSCYKIAEEHGFHNVHRTFGDTCSLIHSEVTEAFESYREAGRFPAYTEVDGKPEGTAVELADIIIRCFDTAMNELGLSSGEFARIMWHKIAYNNSRPFMHNKAM